MGCISWQESEVTAMPSSAKIAARLEATIKARVRFFAQVAPQLTRETRARSGRETERGIMSDYEKHRMYQLVSLLQWRKAVLDQELHTHDFTDTPSVAYGKRQQIEAIDILLEQLPAQNSSLTPSP